MDWLVGFILLLACFGAGATGAIFPPGEWYERLQRPSWTPPNWMFPVVWTSLYILMALAGGMVAQKDGGGIALACWALQITMNSLWTPVFLACAVCAKRFLSWLACGYPFWLWSPRMHL